MTYSPSGEAHTILNKLVEIGLGHTVVYVNSRICLAVFRDWFGLNRLGIDYERSPLVVVHGTNRVQGHLGKSSQPSTA